MASNYFSLIASLEAVQPIRYTPAGIAILEMNLIHSGKVVEANLTREIMMNVQAMAVDNICIKILKLIKSNQLNQAYHFTGFMAPRRRGARSLIFHIQNINDLQE